VKGEVIVLVPARGGSKRVLRKNVRLLGGKPLLAYTIEAARDAGFGEATAVSTDDAEIAGLAREWGVAVIDRPAELAGDTASTESVLLHALDSVARNEWKPQWIATLPPTNPLRRAATIAAFIKAARDGKDDCVFSLTETRGDFWRRDAQGRMVRLYPDAPRRQQDRTPLYEENSAIYVTRVDALQRTGSILGITQGGIAIDPIEGFDINTELDFLVATALIDAGVKAGVT
jgi:CMP-N,N'-diacetyllegionaminic acid synthase